MEAVELVKATGISRGSVDSILNNHLCLRKLFAKWVARMLTIDHKLLSSWTKQLSMLWVFPSRSAPMKNKGYGSQWSHGVSFSGCTRHNPLPLPLNANNNQWWILCPFNESAQRIFDERTTTVGPAKMLFH